MVVHASDSLSTPFRLELRTQHRKQKVTSYITDPVYSPVVDKVLILRDEA